MPVYLYDVGKLHPDDLTGIVISENRMCGIVNNYLVGRCAVPYESIQTVSYTHLTLPTIYSV